MKKSLAILLLAVLFVGSELQAQVTAKPALRTWKDSTGQFSIQATFVRVNGDQVVLQGIDKKEISLPLAKLSAADQQYVKARIPLISDKTDFDATGEKIFNALRERSTAKLQSHIINDVVLNNLRAKIREGVPESLQAAFDVKITNTPPFHFSDRYMAKVSSFFIGFLSNEEARHPELKSKWENIEYIGITGSLPRERDGGRERLIDPFKLTFDYSGSYDPDMVRNATIWFRLDDKIYQMRGIEAMFEIDGKWYGMGDDGVKLSKVTKEQFPPMLTDDLANLRLSMYGGTEKVLVQVREELGLSSAN